MHNVGIKTLKDRLSEFVRAAAAGETILFTDRGQVVAELVPHRVREGTSEAEQRLGDLMGRGLLSPAKAAPKARMPRRLTVTTLAKVPDDLNASPAER